MASKLPHPNCFYAAVGFAANPPIGSRAVTDETRLLLYALYQQVSNRRQSEDTDSRGGHPTGKIKLLSYKTTFGERSARSHVRVEWPSHVHA